MKLEVPLYPQEIEEIFPEELQELLGRTDGNRVILLDVRQPQEYEAERLPGAVLIPLPELPERMSELPKDASIVVYCSSGKRSSVAARILKGSGFHLVRNMVGGVGAWDGPRAFGEVKSWQKVLRGNESPDELIKVAYTMEASLERFYLNLAKLSEAPVELQDVLTRLAEFERSHKEILKRLYLEETGASISAALDEASSSGIIEGAVPPDEIVKSLGISMARSEELLEFALTVEAQAYDFYHRCLRSWKEDRGRDVLSELVQAEKNHMKIVGDLIERFLRNTGRSL